MTEYKVPVTEENIDENGRVTRGPTIVHHIRASALSDARRAVFNIVESAATNFGNVVARGLGEITVAVGKEEFRRWTIGQPSFIGEVRRANQARRQAQQRTQTVFQGKALNLGRVSNNEGIFSRIKRAFFVSPTQNQVHDTARGIVARIVKHRHKNVLGTIKSHRHKGGDKTHRHPSLPIYLGVGGASGREKALAGATAVSSVAGIAGGGNIIRKGIQSVIRKKKTGKFTVAIRPDKILTQTKPLTPRHDYAIFSAVVITLGGFTIGKKLYSMIFDNPKGEKQREVRAWANSPEQAQFMAMQYMGTPENNRESIPPAVLVTTALKAISRAL